MKKRFLQAAKEIGAEITSFRTERCDGMAQVYYIVTNVSGRELNYGYYIGQPDSAKDKMIEEFKKDMQSLISKIESNGK